MFFKVYNDHLFDNLESGKENINFCFQKKNLDPKICADHAQAWKIVVVWLELAMKVVKRG